MEKAKRQVRISELSEQLKSYVLCSPSENYVLCHPEYFTKDDKKYLESLGAVEVPFKEFRKKFVLGDEAEIVED